jgi:pimeloyl-ACP methyl ester carboxylesterase
VGMSGGAMVLPTVYAYAPQRYRAGVLIAGGANFLKISAQSNYADWIDAMVLDWEPDKPETTGRATPDRLERLTNGYLGASRLDATHTAPEMADIPTLVLHATRDRAVPSDTGDALWRLLGQPERWVFHVGHEVIFVMLPTQSGRMQAWIDRTLAVPRGEP